MVPRSGGVWELSAKARTAPARYSPATVRAIVLDDASTDRTRVIAMGAP